MEYRMNSDEFTTRDLLVYLTRAYGCQVNGNSFSQRNIEDWIRLGKLPDAYGGNKIINVITLRQFNDTRILTIEHLDRYEIQDMLGSFDDFKSTLEKEKAKLNKPQKRVRTALYYQMLGSRNNGKKLAAAAAGKELPENWQEAGIKGNQVNKHKKK